MRSLLTKEAWTAFLAALHRERDVAGEQYEKMRSKLIMFFLIRGFGPDCEALADDTLDRVARKYEGEFECQHLMSYTLGVARRVASEARRKLTREAAHKPPDGGDRDTFPEVELRCLEECLRRLPESKKHLIREYYQHQGREKSDGKKRLATALGITLGALTIEAFRIRKQLHKCVLACVERFHAGETKQ